MDQIVALQGRTPRKNWHDKHVDQFIFLPCLGLDSGALAMHPTVI